MGEKAPKQETHIVYYFPDYYKNFYKIKKSKLHKYMVLKIKQFYKAYYKISSLLSHPSSCSPETITFMFLLDIPFCKCSFGFQMGVIYLLPEDLVQLHSLPILPSPYPTNMLISAFWVRKIFSVYLIMTFHNCARQYTMCAFHLLYNFLLCSGFIIILLFV